MDNKQIMAMATIYRGLPVEGSDYKRRRLTSEEAGEVVSSRDIWLFSELGLIESREIEGVDMCSLTNKGIHELLGHLVEALHH